MFLYFLWILEKSGQLRLFVQFASPMPSSIMQHFFHDDKIPPAFHLLLSAFHLGQSLCINIHWPKTGCFLLVEIFFTVRLAYVWFSKGRQATRNMLFHVWKRRNSMIWTRKDLAKKRFVLRFMASCKQQQQRGWLWKMASSQKEKWHTYMVIDC